MVVDRWAGGGGDHGVVVVEVMDRDPSKRADKTKQNKTKQGVAPQGVCARGVCVCVCVWVGGGRGCKTTRGLDGQMTNMYNVAKDCSFVILLHNLFKLNLRPS